VIRRELSFLEGNSFNKSELLTSIKSLKRLGYFETVSYRIENLTQSNLVDVIINVKETNTGSFSFGIGYSSLNSTNVNFGFNEKNFLGEGNKVRFETSLSEKKNTYTIGLTNPYFLNRPLSISTDLYNKETENIKGDIKSSSSGLGVGFGIKKGSLFQKINYNYSSSETSTSTSSTAASSTGEEGVEKITSALSYRIIKDTRDSFYNAKSGNYLSFVNTVAGFGGDSSFFKSVFKSKSYYPINYGDYTFGFKTGAGFVSSLDNKVTSSHRFLIGGKTLRGFDNAGVGPRDTGNNQAIGGNNFYNFSLELRSGQWMPSDTGIEWFVFADAGSIWGTDFETGVKGFDDSAPRITNGFGLAMGTPVGPLQLLWGFPIQSKSYDLEEKFQFSLGAFF
jgi:outer membrane protein insertion porin family